jgi:hypothetical protein
VDYWWGGWDLNPRSLVPKTSILTKLSPHLGGLDHRPQSRDSICLEDKFIRSAPKPVGSQPDNYAEEAQTDQEKSKCLLTVREDQTSYNPFKRGADAKPTSYMSKHGHVHSASQV